MWIMRMAPWWRGPQLLLRRLGVAFALIVAAAVAAIPAAAAAPFLSSSRDATLAHEIEPQCSFTHGVTVTSNLPYVVPGNYTVASSVDGMSGLAIRTKRVVASDALIKKVPGIGAGLSTLYGRYNGSSRTNPGGVPIDLMYRADAMSHIQVVAGPVGKGVWISDRYAASAHLKVGQRYTLTPTAAVGVGGGGTVGTAQTRVAAIYHDLNDASPSPDWWCSTQTLWQVPLLYSGNTPWPSLVLTDLHTFDVIGAATAVTAVQITEYPLATAVPNQDQARLTSTGIGKLQSAVYATPGGLYSPDYPLNSTVTSSLPAFSRRADLAWDGMLPGVLPITAIGILIGLVVVGTAATFWIRRRRKELAVLAAHGASPSAIGLKALVESAPALLVGTVIGWAGARLLVTYAGPGGALTKEAGPTAIAGAVVSFLLTMVVVTVVAGIAGRSLTDAVPVRHRSRLRSVPWELLLAGAAVPVWIVLGGSTTVADKAGGVGVVEHVPGRLLVVPILVVTGLAIFVGRIGVVALRRPARPSPGSQIGGYLGWRRIRRGAAQAAALAAATAIPMSLAAFGAIATGSVQASVDAQAVLTQGAPIVFTLRQHVDIPAALRSRSTELTRYNSVSFGNYTTDVLVIDPTTFASVAFWKGVDEPSLRDLTAPLRRSVDFGAPLPIVASAPVRAGVQTATWQGDPAFDADQVDVTVVSRLPAQQGGYPIALAAAGHYTAKSYGSVQLWVTGDPASAVAAAAAAHLPITNTRIASASFSNTLFEPLTFTFDYLTALSLLSGAVTLVGLLLYLESQTSARRRTFVMLRRMGMAARSHRIALSLEVSTPLIAGLLGGLAAAFGIVLAVRASFDLQPDIPPSDVVVVPYGTLAKIGIAVVVAGLAAALYTHQRIARAPSGEVLRDVT